ncbi:MAG: hypothetical protein LUG95_07985 [Clostridiales bacterium]|nr:hypothetical protein [Clostridiales bacterium]
MIQRITEKTELSSYNKIDLFSIRILSLLNAYSTDYDFAVFYKQLDSHGNITAIISKLDNEYTLSYNSNADLTELADFFTCLGYNSVLSDNAFELGGDFESGVLMKSDKKIELTDRRQKQLLTIIPSLWIFSILRITINRILNPGMSI